jgi:DNA repair ATPase RecN
MRYRIIALAISAASLLPGISNSQSFEAQQLLLNYTKLVQLEAILDNMYKGYKILSAGYNTIKDISEGNFNLHKTFLDGLLAVNPSVAKYKRIPDIIHCQQMIVEQCKRGLARIRTDGELTPDEIRYAERVYSSLIRQSLRNLDELVTIVTATKLRMSDGERLQGIDRLFREMAKNLTVLQSFNDYTHELARQRAKAKNELKTMHNLHGID